MAEPTYSQQLREALNTTRNGIIAQQTQAQASQEQNVTSLAYAKQTLSQDDGDFAEALTNLTFAESINKLATQGSLFVQNCIALATAAATQAASANAAIQTAAAGIKNAANALDTLTSDVAGVHAIAKNDDRRTNLEACSELASALANCAADTVEELKHLSMNACIASAQSTAASTSSSVGVTGQQITTVTSQAAAFLASSAALLDQRRETDEDAEGAAKKALQVYDSSRALNASVEDSIVKIDACLNGQLAASQPVNQALLDVSYTIDSSVSQDLLKDPLPPEVQRAVVAATSIQTLYFFAVPSGEAPSFTLESAMRLVDEALLNDSKPEDSGFVAVQVTKGTYAYKTTLAYDIDKAAIQFGSQYYVFVLSLMASQNSLLPSFLSLPSLVTPVNYSIGAIQTPMVKVVSEPAPTAAGAADAMPTLFKVHFTAGDSSDLVLEYRCLIVRQEVYHAIRNDSLFVAGLLNPSSYKALPASSGTLSYKYHEGDTDIYGASLVPSESYVALILAAGGSGKTPTFQGATASAGKPALPVSTPENTPNVISAASALFSFELPETQPSAQAPTQTAVPATA